MDSNWNWRKWMLCVLVLSAASISPAAEDACETQLQKLHQEIRTLVKANRDAEALARAQQAVALSEQIHGTESVANEESLSRLARLYCRTGQYSQAEPVFQRVLSDAETVLGSDHPDAATARFNLGWFYANLANYPKAEQMFQRALAIREKRFGREHRATAECLNSLAVLRENTGNYREAESLYQEALRIQEKVLGADHPSTATTLNNLASLYWILGDFDQAERDFSRALKIRQNRLGWQHPDTATSLNNLALLYQSLGDYAQAEPLFKRVLGLRQKLLGSSHAFTLTSMSHLGRLYADTGDDARAEPLLRQALEYRERTVGPDHPDTTRNLNDLAMFYDRTGRPDQAEPLYQRALAGRQKTLGLRHPETAASLYGLARHYHMQRRFAEAEPLYWDALKVQQTVLGDAHPETLRTREASAYLASDMGRSDPARNLAQEVVAEQEERLGRLFAFTSERQRLEIQKTLSIVSLAANLGTPGDAAEAVLRTKGLVLDSSLEDRVMLQAAQDPSIQPVLNDLRRVSHRLIELETEPATDAAGKAGSGLTEREQLDQQRKQLETALSRKTSIDGAARRALRVTPGDVQRVLPAHAALVELVRYRHHAGALRFEPRYGAVVLSRDAVPQWISLGRAEDIEKPVRSYQRYVRCRVKASALTDVLRALGRQVWQPIEKGLPDGTQVVVISPDGNLNFVSFATLLRPDDRLLGEQFTLEYVTSGRDLLAHKGHRTTSRNLVVLAAPSFRNRPSARETENSRAQLIPLPGARQEATFLKQQAPGWGITETSYTGTQASEETLAASRSPWILHIATHGLYLAEGDVKGRALQDPMQRSVLALAGAQDTLEAWAKGRIPPEPDGLLTAAEVAALNLEGTWLVVLSACDTGTGEARAGEGVLGLRRGFVQAGAENLLMTLWPVADSESVRIIQDFYQEALRTGNARQALADVQRRWLIRLRKERGLAMATRLAGPFILTYQGR